ncbi:MAG: hypothetical protein LM593_06115 [Candidatus Verstraetearchaeota archaeon]|jgi:hypothetical protein|nr:hypothetical protein [Candidatus Verstraetearchaeota archaeon]
MNCKNKGISGVIGSAIILITFLTIIGTTFLTFYVYSKENIDILKNYIQNERTRMEVLLTLNITNIENRSITAILKNIGSRTIFLKPNWNDIIVYYKANDIWSSYLANYSYNVRVINSNILFQDNHNYINPGEEAILNIQLPDYAPDIPINTTVIVVFVSHYGISAIGEGMRS